MRDPKRIDIFCDELKTIWKEVFPDLRFGQLMDNFFHELEGDKVSSFYLEDDEMLILLKEFANRYKEAFKCK